ncbi:DUF58 domain-containing protein [Sphingomonas sp. BK235]|uniref:DUF58 domain-containing protein n=1 Tax=Sphingomonas sp. BK235 TaxID=2512131 RepID=UPI001051E1F8|nr:DUF58 domain-containing protein [Sphingomonas sp. BK235]TCP29672.1 uncharacterized protein (DUF58 family) [Sphingomonas sp. BK235]
MIYPARAAVVLAAAGAPPALLVAVLLPARWYAGLAWPAAVLLLVALDAWRGRHRATATIALPRSAPVGAAVPLAVTVRIAPRRAPPPRAAEVALAADPLLAVADDGRCAVALAAGAGGATLTVTTLRRGTARPATLWLRWRGPFGLVWHQRARALDQSLPILPDIRPVEQRGAALLRRLAYDGMLAQPDRGDGSEFEALVEFRAGMDRRTIDWKQSARHVRLHARDMRPERNSQIVFAIDTARQMSEPVDGVPRVDRAVTAALLAAWVALKLGDRVALEAFDERPRLSTGFVGGARAFATLQHRAAAIDYSGAESNYVHALSDLSGRLTRRSTVVLFTEVIDLVAAEALVRAATRLVQRHLLLIVVLRDAELEAILARAPAEAADVTRAVTAAGLLRDRLLVLTRLRHLGAHVVEAPHAAVGERLVAAYVDLKRRHLL